MSWAYWLWVAVMMAIFLTPMAVLAVEVRRHFRTKWQLVAARTKLRDVTAQRDGVAAAFARAAAERDELRADLAASEAHADRWHRLYCADRLDAMCWRGLMALPVVTGADPPKE